MITLQKLAVETLRRLLAIGIGSHDTVGIIKGPLRGKKLPSSLAVRNLAVLFGHYEPAVISSLIAASKHGAVAYDVGSHFGFITLALATAVGPQGKVIAFEPVPANLAILEDVILVNKLNSVVKIMPMAVSDTVGELRMVLYESSSTAFLQKAAQGQNGATSSKISVKTASIDSLVLEQGCPPPDIVKIDVEGSESLVIEGALTTLSSCSPTLLIEIHGPEQARKLWPLLHNVGYAWSRVTPQGLIPAESQDECVSLFSPGLWTHHFLMQRN
jgi:FkbM family methyltransferase